MADCLFIGLSLSWGPELDSDRSPKEMPLSVQSQDYALISLTGEIKELKSIYEVG